MSQAGEKAVQPTVKHGIEELSPCINAVDESISKVDTVLEPLLQVSAADVAAKVSPLQKAKLDVISLYAANSLFWVYLKTQGINPSTHGLSKELDRVKDYLKRLKEIEDKKFAPKVNKDASKRVMRNALWSAAHKQPSADQALPSTSTLGEPAAKAIKTEDGGRVLREGRVVATKEVKPKKKKKDKGGGIGGKKKKKVVKSS